MDGDHIGRSLRRLEDFRFLTGTGRYVEDFSPLGPAARGCPALAARACADRRDRRGRRARDAGSARRLHRRRSRRATGSERCPASRRSRPSRRSSCRRARRWRATGCGMSAIRSRSSSPTRASRRATPPSESRSRTGRCRPSSMRWRRSPPARRCCGRRRPATCPTASSAATGRRSRRPLPRRRTVVEIALVNNRLVVVPIEPRAAIGSYDAARTRSTCC